MAKVPLAIKDEIGHEKILARIDGTDDDIVVPLRQYLESRGCEVAVNAAPLQPPLYHIIIGSLVYVKAILANSSPTSGKRLLIVWDLPENNLLNTKYFENEKIVTNVGDSLDSRDLLDIFTFFFTAKTNVLDLGKTRTKSEEPPQQKIELDVQAPEDSKPLLREIELEELREEEHVTRLIRDVFANGSKEKMLPTEDLTPTTKETTFYERSAKTLENKISTSTLLHPIFTVFLFILFWYISMMIVSTGSIWLTVKNLIRGNFRLTKSFSTVGRFASESDLMILQLTRVPFSTVGADHIVRDQERYLLLLNQVFDTTDGALTLYEKSKELSNGLVGTTANGEEKGTPIATVIDRLHNDLFFVQTNVGLTTANLKSMVQRRNFPFIAGLFKEAGEKVLEQLTNLRTNLLSLDHLMTIYPTITGLRKDRTYLLLFQNSSELRPTGGFIGSIGVANFLDGKLRSLQIQDVYDIDGQLKGHVDPPEPVAKFLGQEHWYLRDSNWDPDFRESGARAVWFYEKITGTTVDGAIAINSLFLVDLLKVLGPVDVADFNDHITADNFFGKSLYYTQKNFFPGSTQKKDFLGSLAQAILAKITTGDAATWSKLFRTVMNGFSKKDILFYVKDAEMSSLIGEYGWGGGLDFRGCEIETQQHIPCVADYLSINEANTSINKVNYFIQREGLLTVAFSQEGTIDESLTYVIRNTSTGTSGGGGVYRPYVRLYVPKDVALVSLFLDGVPIAFRVSKNPTDPLPYYEMSSAPEGLRSYGVIFQIEPKSERRLTFGWQRMRDVMGLAGIGVYEYLLQKQPGAGDTPFAITVSYPRVWTITQEGEGVRSNVETIVGKQTYLAKEGELEYNKALTGDSRLKISISKETP